MTPSAEIIRTTHLPQFGNVYFGLKNQYKIVLNIVKKIETILLYFVPKKKSCNKLLERARTWDYILQ